MDTKILLPPTGIQTMSQCSWATLPAHSRRQPIMVSCNGLRRWSPPILIMTADRTWPPQMFYLQLAAYSSTWRHQHSPFLLQPLQFVQERPSRFLSAGPALILGVRQWATPPAFQPQ